MSSKSQLTPPIPDVLYRVILGRGPVMSSRHIEQPESKSPVAAITDQLGGIDVLKAQPL